MKAIKLVFCLGFCAFSLFEVRAQTPTNDNFADSAVITGVTNSVNGSNVNATSEPGEPAQDGDYTIWYSWTAPSSGGAVFQVASGDNLYAPILAIYTGNALTNLTNVAFNNAPYNGGQALNAARAAFTAAGGTTYQIAVGGSGAYGQDEVTLSFNLTPPPTNDLFANPLPISGVYYFVKGSFLGAGSEPGEPSHGADTNYTQTLWWSWTAPTNLGVTNIPVRLTESAVSFPPDVAVFTGAVLTNLNSVTLVQSTNGVSRSAVFTAKAGTSYHIVLAGIENDTSSVLPNFGNFRFRLNSRALSLDIASLIPTTNSDDSISYVASALVRNQGSATSHPLRIVTTAIPGLSERGKAVQSVTATNIPEGTFPPSSFTLVPGASNSVQLTGTAPAPDTVTQGTSSAQGYGVYAQLQEQAGPTNWYAVDETLVLFGVWPQVALFFGPGGGVVRVDPDDSGNSDFNQVQTVAIQGPTTVNSGASADFVGDATYADGTTIEFTNVEWSASDFSITTNGEFTAGLENSNTPVTVTAVYGFEGFSYSFSTNVTVEFVHPAFFTGEAALADGVYYLAFNNGNLFGYYTYAFFPYLYHFDLGFEYYIDANDGHNGAYLFDFASGHFWYTSPTYPFPYVYDFGLNSVLYYYPSTNNVGHYTTNPRYFYNFATGKVITQ